MTSQRAFEAELFAKNHYRKLLTAKSSLARPARPSARTTTYAPNRTLSPLDRYEHRTTNDKICSKLTEIYKCPETAFRRYRRSSEEKTAKSMKEQPLRENDRTIGKTNEDMFQRILCAKSSITEDWKARERQLKRYGKLARRKTGQSTTEECLFEAYQRILMKSRAGSAKQRPKSSRKRQVSSARSRKSSEKVQETM